MKHHEINNTANDGSHETRWRVRVRVLGAFVLAASVGALSISSDESAPRPEKSYIELAQDAAQSPLTEEDVVLIDGIKIKKHNPERNSASEAVLGHPEVNAFMEINPDEKDAILASAMSLPVFEEYAVVERDIDGDGDGDAVAVPKATGK